VYPHGEGDLRVVVRGADGVAIAGAVVLILEHQRGVGEQAWTDADGAVLFPRLAPGRYAMTIACASELRGSGIANVGEHVNVYTVVTATTRGSGLRCGEDLPEGCHPGVACGRRDGPLRRQRSVGERGLSDTDALDP
jgi:hypothetical protein